MRPAGWRVVSAVMLREPRRHLASWYLFDGRRSTRCAGGEQPCSPAQYVEKRAKHSPGGVQAWLLGRNGIHPAPQQARLHACMPAHLSTCQACLGGRTTGGKQLVYLHLARAHPPHFTLAGRGATPCGGAAGALYRGRSHRTPRPVRAYAVHRPKHWLQRSWRRRAAGLVRRASAHRNSHLPSCTRRLPPRQPRLSRQRQRLCCRGAQAQLDGREAPRVSDGTQRHRPAAAAAGDSAALTTASVSPRGDAAVGASERGRAAAARLHRGGSVRHPALPRQPSPTAGARGLGSPAAARTVGVVRAPRRICCWAAPQTAAQQRSGCRHGAALTLL